jgi:hypothetical protein
MRASARDFTRWLQILSPHCLNKANTTEIAEFNTCRPGKFEESMAACCNVLLRGIRSQIGNANTCGS